MAHDNEDTVTFEQLGFARDSDKWTGLPRLFGVWGYTAEEIERHRGPVSDRGHENAAFWKEARFHAADSGIIAGRAVVDHKNRIGITVAKSALNNKKKTGLDC